MSGTDKARNTKQDVKGKAKEAAGKVSGDGLSGAWPPGVTARPFPAPPGYLGAVAAPGDDWAIALAPPAPPAFAAAVAVGVWSTDSAGPAERRALKARRASATESSLQ